MIRGISPAELGLWLEQCRSEGRKPPVVLDVREPWEVQKASVKAQGFELTTIPMASLHMRLSELPRDRDIACLCHHGGRSAQVAFFLKQQGFDQVVNINGGIHAWASELDPSIPRY